MIRKYRSVARRPRDPAKGDDGATVDNKSVIGSTVMKSNKFSMTIGCH